MYEVRGGDQEEIPHAPKPKARGGSCEEQPMPEARGGSREDQRHIQGAMAAQVQARSPSPFAWRPDFPGAPREAH